MDSHEPPRPLTLGADDEYVVAQLKRIDDFEEQLWTYAGLRHAERQAEPQLAEFDGLLWKAGLRELHRELGPWHMALARTLTRLMVHLSLFSAYNAWTRLRNPSMDLMYADFRCREHCGHAVCLLYTVWNQLARCLATVLKWETDRRIYPDFIDERGATDPDVKDDPWLKALAERRKGLVDLFDVRHKESHDRGLLERVFELTGDVEGRLRDADRMFKSLSDEYHFLLDAFTGMGGFLYRNAAVIVRRHTS